MEEKYLHIKSDLDFYLEKVFIDGEYEIFSRIIFVRSRCSRIKRVIDALDDFGTETITKIEKICLEE